MYEELLKIISERGISKYRLAKMSGISTTNIYSILGGKIPLYPAWRQRICDALGMSEEELFPETEGGGDHEEV